MNKSKKFDEAKQKLREVAKRTAREVGHELGEIPRSMPSTMVGKDEGKQHGGGDPNHTSPIVEAMQQKSDYPEESIDEQKSIKRAKELEEEIKRLREQRKRTQKEWSERQEKVMTAEKPEGERLGEVDMPSSKKSRGTAYKPGKKGGPKSPEKRKSKR